MVSFTPTEYGKAKVGKVVIQTEEMQWTYEIKGSHPHYRVPEPKLGGRIANKLRPEVQHERRMKTSTKKNFMTKNMRAAAITQPAAERNSPGRIKGKG